jgi:hypothetical protein
MKRFSARPTFVVMLTVLFLFGLAPAVHAICISSSAPGSPETSHVMADGTVMHTTDHRTEYVTSTEAGMAVLSVIGEMVDETGLTNTLGAIMISAGLTLLTFVGIRLCKAILARTSGTSSREPLHEWVWNPSARARPPSEVDLNLLCISRT